MTTQTEVLSPAIARVTLAVAIAATVVLSMMGASIWLLAALVAVAVFFALFPVSQYLLTAYFGLLAAFAYFLSDFPVSTGFFKLYGSDLVVPFFAWGVMRLALAHRRGELLIPTYTRLPLLLVCLFGAYGTVHVCYSLVVMDLPLDGVFGYFRRLVLYSLVVLLPTLLDIKPKHVEILGKVVVSAGVFLVLMGIYRVTFGAYVRYDEDNPTGYIGVRLYRLSEVVVLAAAVAYATVAIRTRERISAKLFYFGLIAMCVPLMAICGYRLGILYAVAAPIVAETFRMYIGRENVLGLLRAAIVVAILFIAAVGLGWLLFRDSVEQTRRDIMVRQQTISTTGEWRYWSGVHAIKTWKENPMLGAGLGHRLNFPFRGSEGTFFFADSSVHNFALELLYMLGLVGSSLYAAFTGAILFVVFGRIRAIDARWRPHVVSLLILYAFMLGVALLQPLDVSGFVLLHLSLGLVFRFAQFPQESAASAVV